MLKSKVDGRVPSIEEVYKVTELLRGTGPEKEDVVNVSFPEKGHGNLAEARRRRSSSTSAMKRLANVGAILVPMATPLIGLHVCVLNSKMLCFKINFNMVFITCGGMDGGMDGCMVDYMNHVARRVSGDNVVVSRVLIRCLESVRREGTTASVGLRSLSTSPDSFSMGPDMPETTGRIVCGVLCIFRGKYIRWVCTWVGSRVSYLNVL